MFRRIGSAFSAIIALILASPLLAMAQEAAGAAAGGGIRSGLVALGAGLGLGVAALGCGMGQGKLAASAMESIGRNPNSTERLFVPMIIGLAFVESLTLYAFVIAFFLYAKM